jgi:hypothetical protein
MQVFGRKEGHFQKLSYGSKKDFVFGILGLPYLLHYASFWQKRGAFSKVVLGFQNFRYYF